MTLCPSLAIGNWPTVATLGTILLVLIRDGEVSSGGRLVLAADEVGDGFVLGLLSGTLVTLVTLTEELLLRKVNA